MLDEFEIVHWVKFISRFDLQQNNYAINLFFIALATKLLLNTSNAKEPFEVYLSIQNPNFYYFNFWIKDFGWLLYQDFNDSITTHSFYLKLRKGLQPKFNYEKWLEKKHEEQFAESADYN